MINISDLINKKSEKKHLDIKLDMKEINNGFEKYPVLEPMNLIGSLSRVSDILYLDAEVKGVIELECSRCLEKFPYVVDLEINEKLTNDPENKDDEVIFINDENLDINEIIENNVIINLPIQRLCREDCKGLCPMCGTNLNLSTCNCHEENIDPRLEKLKDLFSNR